MLVGMVILKINELMLQLSMNYILSWTSMVHQPRIIWWAIKNNSSPRKIFGDNGFLFIDHNLSDKRHLRIHSFQLSERFVCLQWPLNSIKNCLKATVSAATKFKEYRCFLYLYRPGTCGQTRPTMEVGYCQPGDFSTNQSPVLSWLNQS